MKNKKYLLLGLLVLGLTATVVVSAGVLGYKFGVEVNAFFENERLCCGPPAK